MAAPTHRTTARLALLLPLFVLPAALAFAPQGARLASLPRARAALSAPPGLRPAARSGPIRGPRMVSVEEVSGRSPSPHIRSRPAHAYWPPPH